MFKIERSVNKTGIVFLLSGRIQADRLAEVQKLLNSEPDDQKIALDLKEVKLVDRDGVSFLAKCEAKGITIASCPAYIREWIEKESAQNEESKSS